MTCPFGCCPPPRRGQASSRPPHLEPLRVQELLLDLLQPRLTNALFSHRAHGILGTPRSGCWGRSGPGPSPSARPGSAHPAAVAEALDLLHAELVGEQGGGAAVCVEGGSEDDPPHMRLGPLAPSLPRADAARNLGLEDRPDRHSRMLWPGQPTVPTSWVPVTLPGPAHHPVSYPMATPDNSHRSTGAPSSKPLSQHCHSSILGHLTSPTHRL